MIIGICDDNESDILRIEKLCQKYMLDKNISCRYKHFLNGEEVIAYCENPKNETIDLLFLDVEMPGINGIHLKDQILKNNLIYRIAFVTSHTECVYNAFSLKTIGFINKPSSQEDVSKMINIMREELKDNIVIEYVGYKGDLLNIPLENILYFEAYESYTKIITYEQNSMKDRCGLISKKLGQIEKELSENGFIRVHKSYLVNLANVIDVGDKIYFRNCEITIPIGRKYKGQTRNCFLLYGKKQIRKRL